VWQFARRGLRLVLRRPQLQLPRSSSRRQNEQREQVFVDGAATRVATLRQLAALVVSESRRQLRAINLLSARREDPSRRLAAIEGVRFRVAADVEEIHLPQRTRARQQARTLASGRTASAVVPRSGGLRCAAVRRMTERAAE
jgi:hypothetical protein